MQTGNKIMKFMKQGDIPWLEHSFLGLSMFNSWEIQ